MWAAAAAAGEMWPTWTSVASNYGHGHNKPSHPEAGFNPAERKKEKKLKWPEARKWFLVSSAVVTRSRRRNDSQCNSRVIAEKVVSYLFFIWSVGQIVQSTADQQTVKLPSEDKARLQFNRYLTSECLVHTVATVATCLGTCFQIYLHHFLSHHLLLPYQPPPPHPPNLVSRVIQR